MGARDLAFERAWTEGAGAAARVGVVELVRFAELRAGDGPVRELATRDFAREVLEELADARNYLVWHALQASTGTPADGELTSGIAGALAGVAVAFDHAWWARQRERGA